MVQNGAPREDVRRTESHWKRSLTVFVCEKSAIDLGNVAAEALGPQMVMIWNPKLFHLTRFWILPFLRSPRGYIDVWATPNLALRSWAMFSVLPGDLF